ncbi:hypothetical protein FHS86_000207 [Roseimarinus sediminis]
MQLKLSIFNTLLYSQYQQYKSAQKQAKVLLTIVKKNTYKISIQTFKFSKDIQNLLKYF